MTKEDVLAAKRSLEAEGLQPSLRAIMKHLGNQNHHAVSRHLRALADEDAERTAVGVVAEPVELTEEPTPPVDTPPPPDVPTAVGEAPRGHVVVVDPPLVEAMRDLASAEAAELEAAQRHTAAKGKIRGLTQTIHAAAQRQRLVRGLAADVEVREIEETLYALRAARAEAEEERVKALHDADTHATRCFTARARYRQLREEARHALLRMRAGQQGAAVGPTPYDRFLAQAEAEDAFHTLAGLIGEDEATRLAADPSERPDWAVGV